MAEAFFQQIPLVIFTADRPAEWIDQLDGQTIRQQNIFGAHAKKSYQLPEDYNHADSSWHINRIVNEAVNVSKEFPKGPVHINIPLREPLYPAKGEKISFTKAVRIHTETHVDYQLNPVQKNQLHSAIKKYSKILLLIGQGEHNDGLLKSVEKFCKVHHAVLVGDIISNFHSASANIRYADIFLGQCGESVQNSLTPELLITFGKSIISKNAKLFLRKHKPLEHWHIQPAGKVADTFQSLTQIIKSSPKTFFDELGLIEKSKDFQSQKKENFLRIWEAEEHRTIRSARLYFEKPAFNEFALINEIIKSLPLRCNLHLANSMAVRYANMIGLEAGKKGVHVFCNRGTSGIDGCTSTSVGHALSSDIPNILITGDLAFFYDRNAFWHNYPIPNLHIIVINNHGGIIFKMIDGPADLPESEEYFVTKQKLSAKNLAEEFNFDFILLDSVKKIKNSLRDFFDFAGKTKILEIESNQKEAKESFDQFKTQIKKGYDT